MLSALCGGTRRVRTENSSCRGARRGSSAPVKRSHPVRKATARSASPRSDPPRPGPTRLAPVRLAPVRPASPRPGPSRVASVRPASPRSASPRSASPRPGPSRVASVRQRLGPLAGLLAGQPEIVCLLIRSSTQCPGPRRLRGCVEPAADGLCVLARWPEHTSWGARPQLRRMTARKPAGHAAGSRRPMHIPRHAMSVPPIFGQTGQHCHHRATSAQGEGQRMSTVRAASGAGAGPSGWPARAGGRLPRPRGRRAGRH